MLINRKTLQGKVLIPASKSQTIRAFLIAAFSRGISTIRHPLISDDTSSCIKTVEEMGAIVTFSENGDATVDATSAFTGLESLHIGLYDQVPTMLFRIAVTEGDHLLEFPF